MAEHFEIVVPQRKKLNRAGLMDHFREHNKNILASGPNYPFKAGDEVMIQRAYATSIGAAVDGLAENEKGVPALVAEAMPISGNAMVTYLRGDGTVGTAHVPAGLLLDEDGRTLEEITRGEADAGRADIAGQQPAGPGAPGGAPDGNRAARRSTAAKSRKSGARRQS